MYMKQYDLIIAHDKWHSSSKFSENTINRLQAYVDQKDKKIRTPLLKKLDLLSELYSSNDGAPTMSSGVHGDISNTTAKMLVIYNYLILGEIIRTKNE